jgi:choline dehydrogenase-like flavoprotein
MVTDNSKARKLNVQDGVADGGDAVLKFGREKTVLSRCEKVICTGAIDSPNLLLLLEIGHCSHVEGIGISVGQDLPGVSEDLMDYPEKMLMWELKEPIQPQTLDRV